jgi:thiamine biosynthesis lipoprotein
MLNRRIKPSFLSAMEGRCMSPLWGWAWGAALACVVATNLASLGAEPVPYEQSQRHMGTLFRVVLYAPSETHASKAAAAAFEAVARLDAALSDYKDDSELTLLSDRAGQGPVPVGEALFEILAISRDWSERTDGAFDVTAGPIVREWRRARRRRELPTEAQLAAALPKVGWRKLRLDAARRTAELLAPGMRLDLGGIAKGYACDQALRAMAEHGATTALVDGGGGISVRGAPPGRDGWRISLWAPEGFPRETILLRDAAIATSGDAEQRLEKDGVRYSHIVDPRDGRALTNGVTATVVSPRGADADALAKPACILPTDNALSVIDAAPGAACRLWISEKGRWKSVVSSRWKDFQVLPADPAATPAGR